MGKGGGREEGRGRLHGSPAWTPPSPVGPPPGLAPCFLPPLYAHTPRARGLTRARTQHTHTHTHTPGHTHMHTHTHAHASLSRGSPSCLTGRQCRRHQPFPKLRRVPLTKRPPPPRFSFVRTQHQSPAPRKALCFHSLRGGAPHQAKIQKRIHSPKVMPGGPSCNQHPNTAGHLIQNSSVGLLSKQSFAAKPCKKCQ